MKFFDLHCDTIGECCKYNLSLKQNNLHIDLNRASQIGDYTQVFAVWIPDELRGSFATGYFNRVADCFYKQLEDNKELVSAYGSASITPVKAIFAVEGGSACGGTIAGLYHLYERGVRLITLTWNGKNEIGSGAFSEGGLTPFGVDFIKEAEALGIILDVSHLNRQSFYEFVNVSQKPFVASHSNADIVNNEFGKRRNLTDEQIKIIKERNGIVGLNLCVDFIEDENAKGIDSIYRQVEHFLELDCEDALAFGTDFDGCTVNDAFNGIQTVPKIYNQLKNNDIPQNILDKLFYSNAKDFFK